MKYNLSKHSFIYQVSENKILLYQILTRKGILCTKEILKYLSEIDKIDFLNKEIDIKDVSTFSLSDCLLDNPNGLDKDLVNTSLSPVKLSKIIETLVRYSIIVDNQSTYLERLNKKSNLFDNFHIGNFHQQIGENVLKRHKENAEMWWIYQKFSSDFKSTTDSPYKWVQEAFMEEFFKSNVLQDKKILDFGCGIGYYSSFFNKLGGDVLGVDPSEAYIKIANENFINNDKIKFEICSFESVSDFDFFEDKYDIIFLSDVFLYYFEPYKKMQLTPDLLLQKLNNLLTPKGKIYIMDPHGVFHLQSWMNTENPFMLSLEYANRKYRVTPNLEEFSLAAESANLQISLIRELKYKGTDSDKIFYSEFPFWWFFELTNKI